MNRRRYLLLILLFSVSVSCLCLGGLGALNPFESKSDETVTVTQEFPTPLSVPITQIGPATQALTVSPATVVSQEQAAQSEPACYGWKVHIIQVQETSESSGWTCMTGQIALENINNLSMERSAEVRDLLKELTMTTSEGYEYPVDWLDFKMFDWVPPGLRYITDAYYGPEFESTIRFCVASETTGHIVDSSCGKLDFDNPETTLQFPTDLPPSSFLSIGSTIEFPEGALTLTSVGEETLLEGTEDTYTTNVYFTFTNASQGYRVEGLRSLKAYTIDLEGHLYAVSPYIEADPGQTVEVEQTWYVRQPQALFMMRDDQYWVFILN